MIMFMMDLKWAMVGDVTRMSNSVANSVGGGV